MLCTYTRVSRKNVIYCHVVRICVWYSSRLCGDYNNMKKLLINLNTPVITPYIHVNRSECSLYIWVADAFARVHHTMAKMLGWKDLNNAITNDDDVIINVDGSGGGGNDDDDDASGCVMAKITLLLSARYGQKKKNACTHKWIQFG